MLTTFVLVAVLQTNPLIVGFIKSYDTAAECLAEADKDPKQLNCLEIVIQEKKPESKTPASKKRLPERNPFNGIRENFYGDI